MKNNAKISNKDKMKIITLNNGIKVVLIPRFGLKTVVIEWFFKIGSKYENINEFGLSHFLEHMSFKGTDTRTSKNINNEIDSKGASYNAGTGLQSTSYYVKTIRNNLAWAIELLDNIIFDSIYLPEEFEKEKKVIIEEIKMYQDNPMMGLSSDFNKMLFENTEIGCWDIAGSISDIEKYSRNDVLNYKNKFWKAKNMVIVIAGDIGDEKEIEKIINSTIGNRLFDKNNILLSNPKIVWSNPGQILKKRKDIDQTHIAIGVKAYPSDDKNKYIIKLIEIIIAGNSSSRLYQTIREDRGYSYYIHSISESIKEAGYIAVQTGVPHDKYKEAVSLIKDELISLNNTVTEKELSLAKQYLEGKLNMATDNNSFWTSWAGNKIMDGKKITDPEKMIEKYRIVTIEDIKRVSKEIFKKNSFYSLIVTK